MSRTSGTAVLFVAGLAAAAALPAAGRAWRGDRGDRCGEDGVAIGRTCGVRVVDSGGRSRRFCCVECAERSIARMTEPPREVHATDETTGEEVQAGAAWFVRSPVPACAAAGSHVHVFAREADARRHVEAFGGAVLSGRELPLRERN